MNLFSKIFQQTSWQIIGKIITSLSTFLILGLIARNYGESGTGVFTLALTYLAICYLLADFGFNAHALKKYQISNIKYQNENFRRLLGVRIVWSLMLMIIAVGLLPFWPFSSGDFAKAVLIGSPAIIASAVFITCNLIFQSKLRYDLSVLASSLGTLTSLLVFIFLAKLKYPISLLLLAHVLGWIIIALIALFLVRKFFNSLTPAFDIGYMKTLFFQSWPIAGTLALNVLYFRADSFIIAYFKGISDVGIYNIAYAVFQSALVLPTFIMNAYYPMMLKSLEKVRLVGTVLLCIAIFGTLLTFLLAPFIIDVLTGGGFSGSIASLQILSLGFPAYFLSSLLMWLLVARGKYKSMFLLYTSGIIFNLTLNFIYIPKFSFFAASWITVISEYFILLLQLMVLWRRK